MFKKQKCGKCGKKTSDSYSFCPYCGISLSSEENWGMLGKNDFLQENMKLPVGFNSIFNFLIKNLDKQFSQIQKDNLNVKKTGVSIDISSLGNGVPKINIKTFGNNFPDKAVAKKTKEEKSKSFSEENIKKFLKFKREEPKSEIRRFSDKVVCEIELPGVKSMENISITKLENSIEIRAIAKEKAYLKILPINLPLMDCFLSEGKLVLELEAQN